MTFDVEIDREIDGRWIAEVPDVAGVMTYGATRGARERLASQKARLVLAALEKIGWRVKCE